MRSVHEHQFSTVVEPDLKSIQHLGNGDRNPRSTWVIADLTLGAWRPHQVGSEFAAQLGIPPIVAPTVEPAEAALGSLRYAAMIAAGIEAETRGNQTALIAQELFEQIQAATERIEGRVCFGVFIPRFDEAWGRENLLLLERLADWRGQCADSVWLFVPEGRSSTLPPRWCVEKKEQPGISGRIREVPGLARMIPGLHGTSVRALLRLAGEKSTPAGLFLRRCQHLFPPASRIPILTASRLDYDRLAAKSADETWLQAFAQLHGNNLHVDPLFLCRHAWGMLRMGVETLAVRFLERAQACALDPMLRAAVRCYRQGFYLAACRYAEAAEAPDPEASLPPALQAFLWLSKAWGMILGGDPARGEALLDLAQTIAPTRCNDAESLYLENLRALSALRRGDAGRALGLERAIGAAAANRNEKDKDYALIYINKLNEGRLLSRAGEAFKARRCYEEAFESIGELASDADRLLEHLYLARVDESEGNTQGALINTLRGVLHYAACAAPDSVPPKTLAALGIGKPHDVVEAVADALRARLRGACERCGDIPESVLSASPENGARPAVFRMFLENSLARHGRDSRVVAGFPGCAVMGDLGQRSNDLEHPAIRALRTLAQSLLVALSGCDELARAGLIRVGSTGGKGIPRTRSQCLGLCIRAQVNHMCFAGERLRLGPTVRRKLEGELIARLAVAVKRVSGPPRYRVVHFRRYRAPLELSERQLSIVTVLSASSAGRRLEELLPAAGPEVKPAHVWSLEEARVITLDIPEEVCARVGI